MGEGTGPPAAGPEGCWKDFWYGHEVGVYLCTDTQVWYSGSPPDEQRLVQSLEDFRKDGPPEGMISDKNLCRLRDLLATLPPGKDLKSAALIASVQASAPDLEKIDISGCELSQRLPSHPRF